MGNIDRPKIFPKIVEIIAERTRNIYEEEFQNSKYYYQFKNNNKIIVQIYFF